LKEWAAYKELKKKIENLKEVLPLVIELKKPSISTDIGSESARLPERNLTTKIQIKCSLKTFFNATYYNIKKM